jgi:cysteine desulfurase / selenocysteine lyase
MSSSPSLAPSPSRSSGPSRGFDIDAVRADFPILGERVYGKPLVYLDNAASAQKPRQVIERADPCYEHEYANVHRGLHYLANAATEAFEGARETVRAFSMLSRPRKSSSPGATDAINLVASSFGRHGDQGGRRDRALDHGAPLQHRAVAFYRERGGAVLKWAPVDEDGTFRLDEFEALLTERTKIVAITQMSNVLGTVVPIKEVYALLMRAASRCWSTAARGRCIWASTCATSARFLCLYRPQTLWSHGDRRAVWQARVAWTGCRPTKAAAR